MQIRNFDENILTSTEQTQVRKMIADRFGFDFRGHGLHPDDLPIFLANMTMESVPLDTLALLIKAS